MHVMRCLCGFDGFTIYDQVIQCIRCDSIYDWPQASIEAFNDDTDLFLRKEGYACGYWPDDCMEIGYQRE